MWVQLDNCVKDNKNILMFAHWSLMVAKGIFKEVLFIFSIDDIDASFGWWSMQWHEENFPTIPLLMKSYMNLDNVTHIPHMIEVLDFEAFIKSYLQGGAQCLIRHKKAQQFQFYACDDNIVAMHYKLLYTTQDWCPLEGFFNLVC